MYFFYLIYVCHSYNPVASKFEECLKDFREQKHAHLDAGDSPESKG